MRSQRNMIRLHIIIHRLVGSSENNDSESCESKSEEEYNEVESVQDVLMEEDLHKEEDLYLDEEELDKAQVLEEHQYIIIHHLHESLS